MSTVQSEVKCKQCGFPGAWEVFDCRSNEYTVDCFRCGYRESWKHESYFSNGHLEKGVQEVIYSAGAYCAMKTDNGIEAQA
jgi:predicted nucleic-acid-binding Zn-ribbon protein